jgi:diguanylate cyclase (GGDEF)-like protein
LLIAFIFLSVALIKQNIAAQFMAKTDPLTHLANRRKFNEALQLEWNRCLRQNTPLSLIMADMDYFKQYNDSLGHRAGDQLLCSIAEVLNRYTQRPGDLAARYGGDEFVLLLPNIDAKSAFNLAETIRRVINNKINQRSDNNVTISIGIATTIPTKENKSEKLVLDVDKALYEAKHRGKNCTVVSTPSGINMPSIL